MSRRVSIGRCATTIGALLLAVACSACGAPEEGSTLVSVTARGLTAADVARITVTVSGAGISPPMIADLTKITGKWQAIIGKIPAGTNRTFKADAYDAQDVLLYSGQQTGVAIAPGPPTFVYIVLEQLTPPSPFQNSAPIINGLVVSPLAVVPGGTVSLKVTAHDPDPGDTLAYTWAAASGSFDVTSAPAVTWTAPESDATVSLALTVTDSKGAMQALSVPIQVSASHAKGSANVFASVNTWPLITSISADPGHVAAGATTALTLAVIDADSDPLSFAWSDGAGACAGAFSSAIVQSPTWTAPVVAPTAGSCTLSVAVKDNRGGTTSGSLTVTAGAPTTANAAPAITNTFQSATTAASGAQVLFTVAASDPEGQSLTFGWTAASGSLGTPTNTAGSSEVSWTAPATGNGPFVVSVIVSDPAGGVTQHDFSVTITPPCGNGVMDAGEQCDGANLGGATCTSLGFGPGALACTASCTFDHSGCANGAPVIISYLPAQLPIIVSPGDQVFFSVTGWDPEGEVLTFGWGASAGSLGAPTTTATTSSLTWTALPGCTNAQVTGDVVDSHGAKKTHVFIITQTACCGNGDINYGEQCDGSNLGGNTCSSLGYGGGGLACSPNCTFVLSGCTP